MLLSYLFTVFNHTLQYLLSLFLQDFILEHYSEDSYLYEDEIADLMDLRQVCFCMQQGREDRMAARACRVFRISYYCTLEILWTRRWLQGIGRDCWSHSFHWPHKKTTGDLPTGKSEPGF